MSKSWLTQEAADRLSAELANLETTGRSEIIKKIEAARAEGDLKENGAYHAAREEQGKIESRIRQLRHTLENAEIGTSPSNADGLISPGMKVTVEILGDKIEFLLGSREITSADLDVYSEKSPLGAAVFGAKVGEIKTYNAPNGKEVSVRIIKVEDYS
ncbi:MAG: transcription elongation factor GreA [Actinobacteria bacterium]|nr:transcription elongation factor GreA [Actinomycetota bacterium]